MALLRCWTCAFTASEDTEHDDAVWAWDMVPDGKDGRGVELFQIICRCRRCADKTTIVEGGEA